MMKRRSLLSMFSLAALGGTSAAAYATALHPLDLLNRAGRQCTLSQRMGKAYLAMAIGASGDRAQRVIDESVQVFERQQGDLQAQATRADLKATLRDLQAAWRPYKTLLAQPADRERMSALLDAEHKVSQLSAQAVTQLDSVPGWSVIEMLSLAGRQRTLSQQAAKLYLVQAGGVAGDPAAQALATALADFKQTMAQLEGSAALPPAVLGQLELVRQQWTFLEMPFQGPDVNRRAVANVFSASENVLGVMETVAAMVARRAI